MPEPTPSPSLDEFLAMREANPNAWWRFDSGDHLNLFEEALDALEQLRSGKRINVFVAEELMTLRTRIAELELPASVDPDAADNAWIDYLMLVQIGPSLDRPAHHAFMAGWNASRGKSFDGGDRG